MVHFTEHEGKKVADIKLFALSTCPWCRRTKNFLNENDIEYDYVDVDTLPQDEIEEAEDTMLKYNPQGAFPTIVINGGKEVIIGYDLPKLEALIGE